MANVKKVHVETTYQITLSGLEKQRLFDFLNVVFNGGSVDRYPELSETVHDIHRAIGHCE